MPTGSCSYNCGDTCCHSQSPYHQKRCPYIPDFNNGADNVKAEMPNKTCPDASNGEIRP